MNRPSIPVVRLRRGSILFVTLLLATAMGIALGSYTMLAVQSVKLSSRSFHANSALNLAEAGLEFGLDALNHDNLSDGTWTEHKSGSDNQVKTVGSLNLGGGVVGEIKVVIFGVSDPETARIVALGTIKPAAGMPITKEIEIGLERRSLFNAGPGARESVTVSGGNAVFDAFDSGDPLHSTNGLYDKAKRIDAGNVVSASVKTDAVDLSNSEVWGYVATGGSEPNVGPKGTIQGEDSKVKKDPDRITTDFKANFIPKSAPSGLVTMDPVTGTQSIGTTAGSTAVMTKSLTNAHGETTTIVGDVVLYVTGDISISGALEIADGSSLTLFVAGNMTVGGNGLANKTGLASNLIIYGTADTVGGQSIDLHGNASMSAAIYAPNAHLTFKGGGNDGEMSGSAIANDVKVTGNYQFHLDQALRKVFGSETYTTRYWCEFKPGSANWVDL